MRGAAFYKIIFWLDSGDIVKCKKIQQLWISIADISL